MIIETERLILRPFLESDAADVFEYLHRPAVNCFACMALKTLDEAKAEMKNRVGETEYCFAVTLKDSGKVIGEIDAYPETGEPHADENSVKDTFSPCWMLNGNYQGKGYAFEAAYAFCDYLFTEKGARRIYAYTEDYNRRSQRLCEKLGMRREGLFTEFVSFVSNPDGTPRYENTLQYAILKREWEEQKKKKTVSVKANGGVTLTKLTASDRERFILDNQYAFKHGISVEYRQDGKSAEDFDGEIISRETIENSIDGGEAYRIRENGKSVGGLVLSFRKAGRGELELLFVSPDVHSRGIGFAAWREVERLYSEIKIWETCTPSFETRNVHFYVNKCGFRIVEFFNAKHPDPHDPETGKEERREDFGGGMFRFEKEIR